MPRLPKYVQAFIDRTGKSRHYIRRRGYPRTALPGMPWGPTFMAAYEEAMARQNPIPARAGSIRAGSFRALAVSYLGSPAFANLAHNSKRGYRGVIEAFCKTKDANGNLYGDKPLSGLSRSVIVKILAGRAERPRAANKLLMILRILMQHGVEQGLCRDNPARDIKSLKTKSKGHHSWTEERSASSNCTGQSARKSG